MKKKILIVGSNYYKKIYSGLLNSAKKELKKNFRVYELLVPGAFEIPVVISKKIKNYDAVIALGCIIKGQTPHFDFIAKACTDAIMRLSIENKKPIGNGIITCLNMSQAIARKHKGKEAAQAVISVLSI